MFQQLSRSQLYCNIYTRNYLNKLCRRYIPVSSVSLLLLYICLLLLLGLLVTCILTLIFGMLVLVKCVLVCLKNNLSNRCKIILYSQTFTCKFLNKFCLLSTFCPAASSLCRSTVICQIGLIALYSIDLKSAIFLDTGYSQYIFYNKDNFQYLRLFGPSDQNQNISGIGSTSFQLLGIGEINLVLQVQGIPRIMTLTNILYCPSLQANLISGSQLIDCSTEVGLTKRGYFIYTANRDIAGYVFSKAGLYIIDI